MSLKETLLQDLKAAMKDKDIIRKNTIQLVRSGVLQIEKDNQVELDDDGVLDVVAKELKKRRDSLPEYEKSGRNARIRKRVYAKRIQGDLRHGRGGQRSARRSRRGRGGRHASRGGQADRRR